MRRVAEIAAVAATVGFAVAWSADAHAWCRTTTTQNDFEPTPKVACNPTGVPLAWASRCISFSVQKDASVRVDLTTAQRIADLGFSQWAKVPCPLDLVKCSGTGGGFATISGVEKAAVPCGNIEFNKYEGNTNVIVFRDKAWPHQSSQIALTTVTYIDQTGELVDADMEINSHAYPITLKPSPRIGYDLQSVITHEAGHFFGLAHTAGKNEDATMFARYSPGETNKRDLKTDDACGICNIYPPTRVAKCDDHPLNGASSECHGGGDVGKPIKSGCHCGTAVAAPGEADAGWSIAGLTLAACAAARSRFARRRSSDFPRTPRLRAPRRFA